jgi:uncharacterized protein (TIGR03067 family)
MPEEPNDDAAAPARTSDPFDAPPGADGTAAPRHEAASATPSASDLPVVDPGTAPRPVTGSVPRTREARETPRPPVGPRIQKGSLRLFRAFGVDVFVHWSWFIAVYFQLRQRTQLDAAPAGWHYRASPNAWHAAELLTLFAIVVLHEFGHALACRSVGGRAERIYLWPLGGVAFVNPPQRPGPFLWSIVAGPLVNLLLVPPTVGLFLLAQAAGVEQQWPDAWLFLLVMMATNLVLLLFNLLPIFPLDGGQILQGLLWFFLGRARSLQVVALLAIPFAALLGMVAVASANWWLALIVAFILLASLGSLARAGALLRILRAPRREGHRCPTCGAAPPVGEFWVCSRCMLRYDTFAHQTLCPRCGNRPAQTMCAECLQSRPFAEWVTDAAPAGPTPAQPLQPPVPPPGRLALPRPGTRVSHLERAGWAACLAALVLVGGWVVAGRNHPGPVLVVALGGAILGATQAEALSRGRRARSALNRLRGSWHLVELDGKDLTATDGPAIRITISGYGFTERTGAERTVRGYFWLDATKQPALINIIPNEGPMAGSTYQGLYEVDGKVWRVCVSNPGRARPTELGFEADQQHLMVYRRE